MYPKIKPFPSAMQKENRETKTYVKKRPFQDKSCYLDGAKIKEKYTLRTLQEPGSLK